MTLDWTAHLLDQLTFHWEHGVRPRLVGLTDEEYRWEPVAGAWSVRPRAEAVTRDALGRGAFVLDHARGEPDPAPFTTIAWRLAHVTIGVFGERNHSHFDGPPTTYATAEYAADADTALAQLDAAYAWWVRGVSGLDVEALARPVGPAEGPFAEAPYLDLVLHIHREAIHHLAEVCLLRDLYAAQR
ncbi:MAG: serine/arginine repetitive matrix protein 1 [Ilumatobacteraceae bacterium]|nr:serine/arginine repetitive matrix protein 1 [Ilumatobacteraceae bacterium]